MSWAPTDLPSYAYLLGLYLGDGCITRPRRSLQLVTACDARYPGLIEAAADAVRATGLCRRCRMPPRPRGGVRARRGIESALDRGVPQHGPGRNHDRLIALEPWQQAIVDAHPWAFRRGLLHSDGCRTVHRFRTKLPSGRVGEYGYPRWFFSNRSADIRGLFCATCDAVGVRWTQSNPRNISVSHRDSVALLDAHVGAKA